MKSYKDPVLIAFPDIAKLVGAPMCRSTDKFEPDYIDIVGKGIAMRVRWVIERDSAILVTLYKVPDEDRRPKELNLSWFVKFKKGNSADLKVVDSSNVDALIDVAKKYALGYLLGQEEDFDEVAKFARIKTEEKFHSDTNIKPVKWIREEWLP